MFAEWIEAFKALLFPTYCRVCEGNLMKGEQYCCFACNAKMPRTDYHLRPPYQEIERLIGAGEIERLACYFRYGKKGGYGKLIHALKYQNEKHIGVVFGANFAKELQPSGFFDTVDLLLPVPLHAKKSKQRGYNQSEQIAKGIQQVTHIPLETERLQRIKATHSQTKKSVLERWDNMQGAFENRDKPFFARKHILLIDDVLTTGATITACVDQLRESEEVKISILTLAIVS